MSDMLPLIIDPWALYRHGSTIVGKLPLAEMPYLLASQNRDSGEAAVSLSVVQRDDGEVVITGQASIDVVLDCQRCLEPMTLTLAVDLHLVLLKHEKRLETIEEDAVVCQDMLELAPLIEQEFILVLPIVAKHENCELAYQNIKLNKRENPFANLKDLLN
ncbi:YceD family protein [Ostreibacterium oceani]|nr:YceD family protein [Ostreibacterium oceani]